MPSSSSTAVLNLSPNVQLRLRQPKLTTSSNGSVLLKSSDGIWDCVQCKEWTEVHYKEEGWINRHTELFGTLDEEELEKIAKENENEENFKTYRRDRLRSPINNDDDNNHHSSPHIMNTNYMKLMMPRTSDEYPTTFCPAAFLFIYSKWDPDDGTLELFVARNIASSKESIASTEYTSLLLSFELVEFDDDGDKEEEIGGGGDEHDNDDDCASAPEPIKRTMSDDAL